jgi:ornithine cyclodeaminase/alanine dehydrogenase-like protein (mu-crystallin family)
MKVLTADDVAQALPHRDLVEALREGFREGAETPVRHHHATSPVTTLLLMPSWNSKWSGLKTVTIKADNGALGLPSIQGSYLLIDNATAAPVAVMDAGEITRRRTAAASALAADYLARPDARTLALFGAGALAPHFLHAHASVRPIERVLIVNRSQDKAAGVARILESLGFEAEVTTAERAAKEADVISCITNSSDVLVEGEWLRPGTHLDLVGAYKPSMREVDAEAVARASVFVDTYDVARAEAGDLIQAEAEGRFRFGDIKADLAELCRGQHRGRQNGSEITLFKSCGTGLEDLAAAVMAHLRTGQ